MECHASLSYHYNQFLPGFRCLISIQIPAGLQIHKTEWLLHCDNCLKLFCKTLHSSNCLQFHQSENLPTPTITYNGSTFMGSVSIITAHLFFRSSIPNLTSPSSGVFCCYRNTFTQVLLNAFSLKFLLCLSVLPMSF